MLHTDSIRISYSVQKLDVICDASPKYLHSFHHISQGIWQKMMENSVYYLADILQDIMHFVWKFLPIIASEKVCD